MSGGVSGGKTYGGIYLCTCRIVSYRIVLLYRILWGCGYAYVDG